MCNKRSSDFRWAPEKDPTKEAKKAEKAKKLLKAEQKKRLKTEQKKQAKIEAKAARAQKRRNKNLEDLEKGLGLVFSKNFKGLLYNVYGLAYTMSALAICYFGSAIVSIFSADIISLGLSLWIGIVALIDAVGLWKILLPFRKIQPGDTKAFTGFLSLQKILNVISFVLCEIVAATLLTASIALMIASSEILDLISTGVIQIGDISGGNVVVNADVIHGLLSSFPSILFISGIFVSASAAVYFVFYKILSKE